MSDFARNPVELDGAIRMTVHARYGTEIFDNNFLVFYF